MQIRIGKSKVSLQVLGEGKPIILLHGWQNDKSIWEPLIPYLLPLGRLILPDLPGFGKSQLPSPNWKLDNYAQFISLLMDELQIKKAVIIGHSFGGRVAIKFASLWPKKTEKLILVDSGGVKEQSLSGHLLLILAKLGKIGFKLPPLSPLFLPLRKYFYAIIRRRDYLEAGKLKKVFLAVIKEDLTPLLSQITNPTLIIWGKEDRELAPKLGKIMQKAIPSSRLYLLESCGHFPFLDKPKEFSKIITKFLEDG